MRTVPALEGAAPPLTWAFVWVMRVLIPDLCRVKATIMLGSPFAIGRSRALKAESLQVRGLGGHVPPLPYLPVVAGLSAPFSRHISRQRS